MRSWAMTWRRYLIDLAAIAVKEVHLLRGIMNSTEYPASTLLRSSAPLPGASVLSASRDHRLCLVWGTRLGTRPATSQLPKLSSATATKVLA
jgi:hypothetical protein